MLGHDTAEEHTPLPGEDLVFGAVADEIRRKILRQLRAEERKAGDIAAAFDISWPAISRHLRVLKNAGLVLERKQGRERYYSLNRQCLRDVLRTWAAAFDVMWQQSLESLKLHLESERQTRGAQ